MPSYIQRLNAQRDRIAFREVFRLAKTARDKLAIFFHKELVLISWRIVAKRDSASQDNDISTLFVSIEVERDAGIGTQVCLTFGVGHTIYQDVLLLLIPPVPDGRWLWGSF